MSANIASAMALLVTCDHSELTFPSDISLRRAMTSSAIVFGRLPRSHQRDSSAAAAPSLDDEDTKQDDKDTPLVNPLGPPSRFAADLDTLTWYNNSVTYNDACVLQVSISTFYKILGFFLDTQRED